MKSHIEELYPDLCRQIDADKRLRHSLWIIPAVTVAVVMVFVALAHAEVDMGIIGTIESNNNPHAYNARTQARGEYQITPICAAEIKAAGIADVYGLTGATWYMNVRIPAMLTALRLPDTTENRLIAYNAGIGVLKKYLQGKRGLKKETRNYIAKYNRIAAYVQEMNDTIKLVRGAV